MGILFFNTGWFQLEENPDIQTGRELGDPSYGELYGLLLDAGG